MRLVPAALVLALTACSDGVSPPAALTASPAPATAAPATAAPTPSPTRAAVVTIDHAGRLRGDLDGDGKADVVTIVENGPRDGATWRFGVRAAMTALGTRTAWAPEGMGGNDGQTLTGLHDVDGDGRAEVGVALGTTATAGLYSLVTVVGDRLVLADPTDLWAGQAEGLRGWGCAGGRVYTTDARRGRGTITYYRYSGGRLIKARSETVRWRAGETPPAPFGDTVDCGDIEAHAQPS